MAFKVYLVDQDEAFCEMLVFFLTREGCQVTVFGQGVKPLDRVEERPDLWIISVDDGAGFKVMTAVKAIDEAAAVILTSAREQLLDRVLGLELGCEDFLLKPLSPRELVLRIRKMREPANPLPAAAGVNLQEYKLEPDKRIAVSEQEVVGLTSKEFELLLVFCRHRGLILSREQILQLVWGEGYSGPDRVVDDLVRRTRRKMKKLRIETIYGYGYRVS
ncbi:response regulator transcription factor|uniref:Two-component system, OmpR family, response regulator CssR n=1 Tax=Dendrosporobacter quercicolus TaxID=146817 RepID=A0A1G9VTU9_9FIRM|nr:response regulator transcription factor [Dendrosporobacter quercicolus]NSL47805.1 response regulator transcription factor [Dendrosporobacter quercicolus DSM 1736]SDM75426.1 two-component system, OmpR family, response regulator CssR [Dendrosporobacter quercicolus]